MTGGTLVIFRFVWLQVPLLEPVAAPVARAIVRRGNRRSLERLAELPSVFWRNGRPAVPLRCPGS